MLLTTCGLFSFVHFICMLLYIYAAQQNHGSALGRTWPCPQRRQSEGARSHKHHLTLPKLHAPSLCTDAWNIQEADFFCSSSISFYTFKATTCTPAPRDNSSQILGSSSLPRFKVQSRGVIVHFDQLRMQKLQLPAASSNRPVHGSVYHLPFTAVLQN